MGMGSVLKWGLIAGGVLLVAFIIFIICCRRRQRQSGQREPQTDMLAQPGQPTYQPVAPYPVAQQPMGYPYQPQPQYGYQPNSGAGYQAQGLMHPQFQAPPPGQPAPYATQAFQGQAPPYPPQPSAPAPYSMAPSAPYDPPPKYDDCIR